MGIDWFTVSVQIVNFLILVWLLKKFLYRPVLDAMERRQQGIASRVAEAEALKQQAAGELAKYKERQIRLAEEAEAVLHQARLEAERLRQTLEEKARAEVEALRSRWYAGLAMEKKAFLDEAQALFVREFVALSEQGLAKLAGGSLCEQMVERFLEEAAKMERADLSAMAQAVATLGEATVVTSHPLSPELQERLRQGLAALLGEVPCRFVQEPRLIAGIRIEADGRRLAWDLAHLVDLFSRRLRQGIEQEIEPQGEKEQ